MNPSLSSPDLLASMPRGFADATHDAQAVFRNVLDALSRPGRLQTLQASDGLQPPAPLSRGVTALLLTLMDTEASLYDPELAALALKQARGDAVEAIFLLRAYRTTLPRVAFTEPLDAAQMRVRRRVSAIFKDLPGGQLLGPTYDYTQRLLDFSLLGATPPAVRAEPVEACTSTGSVRTEMGVASSSEKSSKRCV